MKLLAVGDVHGRDFWKEVVDLEKEFDRFVFVGDYFDSWDLTVDNQIANFNEIVAFKREHPEKVVLLLGNHDYHYLYDRGQYSGFKQATKIRMQEPLQSLLDEGLLQVAYQHNDLLFTHAGVTKTWCKHAKVHIGAKDVAAEINRAFAERPELFNFIIGGGCDPSGDDVHQSPMWVRPDSLREDHIGGVKQVVGHTTFKQISVIDEGVIFLDAPSAKEYLKVVDEEASIETTNETADKKTE